MSYHKTVVFDRNAKRILESIQDIPKSAIQIIVDSNIAQSTAYRKLKKMADANALRVEYVIGEHGRWEMRYKKNLCLINDKTKGSGF